MSQPPGFSYGFIALCQRALRKAETEKDNSQLRLCVYVWARCSVIDKRAVKDRIIKRESCFQMRPGYREPAGGH